MQFSFDFKTVFKHIGGITKLSFYVLFGQGFPKKGLFKTFQDIRTASNKFYNNLPRADKNNRRMRVICTANFLEISLLDYIIILAKLSSSWPVPVKSNFN